MAVTFLDDEPVESPKSGGITFLDDEPQQALPQLAYDAPFPEESIPESNPVAAPPSSGPRSLAASAARFTLNSAASATDAFDAFNNLQSQAFVPSTTGEVPNRAPDETTNLLRDAASGADEVYDVNPRSQNAAAQIGRGAGMVLGGAPGMVLSGPLAMAQMGGATYEETYKHKEDALRAGGITDEAKIADEASREAGMATLKVAPQLAAYTIGGKLAAGAVGKMLGEGASVAAKTVGGFAGAEVANVGTGAVLRAFEAKPGERLDAAVPKIENLTADTLFALFHGHGEYKQASAEARSRAGEELKQRGFDEQELASTGQSQSAPAEALVPAAGVQPEVATTLSPSSALEVAQPEISAAEAKVVPSAEPVAAAETVQAQAEMKAAQVEEVGLPATAEAIRARASEEVQKAVESIPPEPEPARVPSIVENEPVPEIHTHEADLLKGLESPLDEPTDTLTGGEPDVVEPAPVADDLNRSLTPAEAIAQRRMELDARREQSGALDDLAESDGYELLDALKQVGGLPVLESDASFTGETRRLWETDKGSMMRLASGKQKLSLDQVRDSLEQYGFKFETPDDLLSAVEGRLTSKKPVYGFEPASDVFASKAEPVRTFTPKASENTLIEKIRDAIKKAPTEAELDAKGKQPTTMEFERVGGVGSATVQNTKEALQGLLDRSMPRKSETHLQRVAERVEGLKQQVNGVRVRVLRNEADLPAYVRKRLEPGVVHEGIVDTTRGDVFIFADNITSADRAAEVFAHEVVGHYGIEKLVREQQWNQIADSIMSRAPEEAKSIARRYAGTEDLSKLNPEQRATVAREYIARLAEKPQMDPVLWRRVVATIRRALRELGITREWSENDIKDLIRQSNKIVREPVKDLVGEEGQSIFYSSVRDLGKEVEELSPYARKIEDQFEKRVPDADRRAVIDEYVKTRLAGDEGTFELSSRDRVAAERFVRYFEEKVEYARSKGVEDQVREAYAKRLADNPSLSLAERVAVLSAETNRAVVGAYSSSSASPETSAPSIPETPGETIPSSPEPATAEPTSEATKGGAETEGESAQVPPAVSRNGGAENATPNVTSIKNARVDEERAKRGLPAAMEPARRSFGAVWDEAMKEIEANPLAGKELADRLEAEPRAVTDKEDALLLHRQIEVQNDYDRIADDLLKARTNGNADLVEAFEEKRGKLSEELLKLYNVDEAVGTATSRGLNARKMMVNEDYSLAKMVTNKRVANGGKQLTPEQTAEVTDLHAKIADLTRQLSEHDEVKVEAMRQEAMDAAFKQLMAMSDAEFAKTSGDGRKKPSAAAAKPSTADKVLGTLKTAADAARERIKERRKRFNAGVDPTEILDLAVVGAEKLARASVSIGRFTAQMVMEFGEYVRPVIAEVYAKAKQLATEAKSSVDLPKQRENIVAGIKERIADGDAVTDLSGFVRKLALNLVRSGVTEREPLLDAVNAELQAVDPAITRRETMDLISGYGDFKALDPEQAKATLRDLKGQMQQIGKIEDMEGGKAPRKTGVQRREVSAEESKLVKAVNEAKKRGGFEVTDPATQLRSALGAKERALSNEIRSVAEELATGEVRKAGAPSPTSPRVEELKALLERLRATRDEVFRKPELTDEQRLAALIKSADRSTAEYDRQVADEDFTRKAKKPKLSSAEYEAAKARRDAARAERDEFAALDEGLKVQKEADRTEAIQDQIAELDRKLTTGDTDPTRPVPPLLTPEQQKLVAERDAKRKELATIRRNPKPDSLKQVERILKQIDAVDEKLRTGDLGPKGKRTFFPLSEDAANLLALRDARVEQLQEARDALKPKLTDEELALKRWKSATLRRTAELQDKVARGDFAPKPERMPLKLDAEGTRLSYELDKAKGDYNEGRLRDMLAQRSVTGKILGGTAEVLNTARGVMTAFDLSAVLRQGGFIVLARPVRALRIFPAMFKAMAGEKGEYAVNEEIAKRPNAPLYKQAKLEITESGAVSLAKMEEAYMSRWAEKIPGVGASGRAYRTFLNRLRADSFDAMVKTLGGNGRVNLKEAKAIANFINVATGRAKLGPKYDQAAAGLNTVFFAPKLVASRIQLLAGQPLYGGTGRTRALIAGEYARYLTGVALVTALAASAGATVEKDPTSGQFMKIKFGNTRIDLLSGLIQSTVFLSREAKAGATYLSDANTGRKTKDPQYGDGGKVLGRFLQSKLAPIPGAILTALNGGRNLVGEKQSPADLARGLVVPMTYSDILANMKEQGVPAGAALSILTVFGAGVQNYDEKKKR